MGYIYGLLDTRNNSLRYIGKTTHNPMSRLAGHIDSMYSSSTQKDIWMRELAEHGLAPRVIVLEEVENTMIDDRERFWVSLFSCANLLNSNLRSSSQSSSWVVFSKETIVVRNTENHPRFHNTGVADRITEYIAKCYVEENRIPGPSEISRELEVSKSYAKGVRDNWIVENSVTVGNDE